MPAGSVNHGGGSRKEKTATLWGSEDGFLGQRPRLFRHPRTDPLGTGIHIYHIPRKLFLSTDVNTANPQWLSKGPYCLKNLIL